MMAMTKVVTCAAWGGCVLATGSSVLDSKESPVKISLNRVLFGVFAGLWLLAAGVLIAGFIL